MPIQTDDPRAEIERLAAQAGAFLDGAAARADDTLAVVLTGDMSPDSLRDWVAENTALRAYQGSLRGSRGVLADRQGNSLDRALLLVEMLGFAGYDARLVRAGLSHDDVTVLRGQLGKQVQGPQLVDPANAELIASAPPDAEVSQDDILCGLEIERRIESQTDALMALAGGISGADALVDAALADHWWVQVNDAGSWRDLDPSDLTAQADWSGAPDEVPDSLRHTVSVGIVAEVADGARFDEVELIAMRRPATEFAGRTLAVRFEPTGAPPLDAVNLEEWLAAARMAPQWVPILALGDDADAGRSIKLTGGAGRVGGGDKAEVVGQTGAALGGLLGGLGGGGLRKPAKPRGGVLSALWIDYRIEVPGRPVQQERRTLFDLRGPGARLAGTPLPATLSADQLAARERGLMSAVDIYITAGDPTPLTLPRQRVTEALRFARAVEKLFTAAETGDASAAEAAVRALPTASPLMLYALVGLRSEAVIDGLGPLHDQPTILSMHRGPGAEPDTRRVTIDIVRTDPAIELGPRAAMRRGVADTVLEAAILDEPGQPRANAADILETSLRSNVPWAAAKTEAELARFELPGDVLALMRASIAAGNLVVAPLAPVGEQQAVAWWRIDPVTGATLGMSASGHGAGTLEYIESVFSISIKVSSVFGCTSKMVDLMAKQKADTQAVVKIGICFANAALGAYTPYMKLKKLQKIRRLNFQSKIRAELYRDYLALSKRVAAGGKGGIGSFTKGEKALYDMFAGRGSFTLPGDAVFIKFMGRFTDVIAAGFTVSSLNIAGR